MVVRESVRISGRQELRFTASPIRGEWSTEDRITGDVERDRNGVLDTPEGESLIDFSCPFALRPVFPRKLDIWGRENDEYELLSVSNLGESVVVEVVKKGGPGRQSRSATLTLTNEWWFPASYIETDLTSGEPLETVRCYRTAGME